MFLVLITPAITAHVRGYISRFLIEAHPNVFVGNCSPRVRDNLWERVSQCAGADNLTLIYSDPRKEQGYSMWFHGAAAPTAVDLDGLLLVARPQLATNGPKEM